MNQKQVFFSVIIPTLNEEDYLPKLLEALKRQKNQNFEVIIIDGGSKDNTSFVTKSIQTEFPIKFINCQKKNVSYQRNLGAKKAKGRYLLFLDADSYINPNFTINAQKYIQKHPGLIFLPFLYPEEKRQYPDIKLIFSVLNELVDLSQNLNQPFSMGGSMVWERNLFRTIGGFDENISITEDCAIVRKAKSWGVRAKMIKSVKIRMSLRRLKKEGRLTLFYKTILLNLYLLVTPKIKKKLFEYEMGGHLYKQKQNRSVINEMDVRQQVKKMSKLIHRFFTRILKE